MSSTGPTKENTQKYVVLANLLGGKIESGELKPGAQLPSMADLRVLYGASQPTAERAYSLLERDGLIIRKPYRGVFVADLQQTRRQCILGVSMPSHLEAHNYYERVLRGIRSVARDEQLELLILHENSVLRWEKVDGVLLTTHSRAVFESLPQGMPAVSLLQPLRAGVSVVADDEQGMRTLVEHLLAQGHRGIALFTAGLIPGHATDIFYPNAGLPRVKGYYEAMRAAGIEPDPRWLRPLRAPGDPMQRFEELGRVGIKRWLAENWAELGCTAFLAHNDETAIGVIEALQEAGIRVPEDVSVAGFDGLDIAEYFRPRLTTVEVPLEEIGAKGARLLLEQVRMPLAALRRETDQKRSRRLDLEARLRIGDSSGPYRGP